MLPSSGYFHCLGTFNWHVRLFFFLSKQTHKHTKQFAFKLAKLQHTHSRTHTADSLALRSRGRRGWEARGPGLRPSPVPSEHYFLARVFPSWLFTHPLNMYLINEELKRGDMSANGLGG